MKHVLMCLMFVGLFICAPTAEAQRGPQGPKPLYTVEARRGGQSIGSFTLELFPFIAPKAVHYFDSLVGIHFYDTTAFHRVIPGFMIQGGDPNSRHGNRDTWGTGSATQLDVEAEFSPIAYTRGILGAARDNDTNSANSQFFVCVANALHLNGLYTAYGRAISGMNVVDSIVKAPRDTRDNPFDKIEAFITRSGTNDSVPVAPTLLAPLDSAESISTTTSFSWTRPRGAVLYDLEISEDSLFSNIVARGTYSLYASSSTGPELMTVSGFNKTYHRYYWHVRTNNGGYLSPFSSPRSFVTQISQTRFISPDSLQADIHNGHLFRWSKVEGADSYHLRVAKSPLFTNSSIVFNNAALTDTSCVVNTLDLGTKYYWKISAIRKGQELSQGTTWSFNTALTDAVENESALDEQHVYPQPADSHVIVQAEAGSQLFLCTMAGKEIMSLKSTTIPGSNQVRIGLSEVPSGSYLLIIRAAGQQKSLPLIIAH